MNAPARTQSKSTPPTWWRTPEATPHSRTSSGSATAAADGGVAPQSATRSSPSTAHAATPAGRTARTARRRRAPRRPRTAPRAARRRGNPRGGGERAHRRHLERRRRREAGALRDVRIDEEREVVRSRREVGARLALEDDDAADDVRCPRARRVAREERARRRIRDRTCAPAARSSARLMSKVGARLVASARSDTTRRVATRPPSGCRSSMCRHSGAAPTAVRCTAT